ncbi:hypothetical protein HK405_007238 [Cladochytrium tenue]|nr:hypothetical protein HK405_007238 [Cladochytrium tenue]
MAADTPEGVIASVLHNENLYARLGLTANASSSDIRRSYLRRSLANEAFQRLSSAYQTLKSEVSRQNYDLYGRQVDGNEQSFSDTLAQAFEEFLNGQFDTLIRMVDLVQTSMREFFIWGGGCWDAAKLELIRLWDLQYELSQLSYLDVFGRWRVAGRLSHGILRLIGTAIGMHAVREGVQGGPSMSPQSDDGSSSRSYPDHPTSSGGPPAGTPAEPESTSAA